MKKWSFRALKTLAVAFFWVGVWYLISRKVGIEFLFPSPKDTLASLLKLAGGKEFWLSTAASLLRVLTGILMAWLCGILIGVAVSRSRLADALLSPVLTVIKATPVASFIVLALLWIERDRLPVFITLLMVLPIVCSNVAQGIRSVDVSLAEVAKVFHFSRTETLRRLYLPSVAPYFMAACRSSLGMAWKAGIAAEVLSTPQLGIGTELYFSKTYLETSDLFAWTLVVILLSMMIEKLLVWGLECLGRKLRAFPVGGHDACN